MMLPVLQLRGFGMGCALALLLVVGQFRAYAEDAKRPDLYRLRAGDQVAIAVTPQKAYDCGGMILPDGMLYLKNVGALKAVGITLPELENQVRKTLSEKLVSPKVSATLLQIASSAAAAQGTVTLTGAVGKTGSLPLEEGLRIYKALELAGGPLKNADLSRIGIVHRDLTRSSIDLSAPERIVNPEYNQLLKDGDSIEIPARPTRTATIRGAVARPGVVELEGEVHLWQVLDLAGGLTREADQSAITIVRSDLTRATIDLSAPDKLADPARNMVLRGGEIVEIPLLPVAPIPTVREPQVRIRGNVINPGRYPFHAEMELVDLIEAAGKLAPAANPTKIQLQRGEQIQTIDLVEQEKKGFTGKVVLLPGDDVFIPEHVDRVILIGAVPKYGPAVFKPGQTIREFFTQGGADVNGALNPAAADLKKVQLIRRGEAPIDVNLQELILKPTGKKVPDVTLATGDVIFFPPKGQGGPRGPLKFLSQLGPLGFLFSVL